MICLFIPLRRNTLKACRSETDVSAYAVGGDAVSLGLQR
jgi:hypothetical protein